MYGFSTRKVGFPSGNPSARSSTLPTPDDDAAEQYRNMDFGQPIPSILSRTRRGLDDLSVRQGRLETRFGPEGSQRREHTTAPYTQAGYLSYQHLSPPNDWGKAQPRFYTWRPEVIPGNNVQKNGSTQPVAQQTASKPEKVAKQTLLTTFQRLLGNDAESRETIQTVPQKRRMYDRNLEEPTGGTLRFSMPTRNGNHPQSNPRITGVLSAHTVAPLKSPQISDMRETPQQLPPLEAELLEVIQDHYCEEGDRLHSRVTTQLSQHHGELSQRLNQVAALDGKFLRRLNNLNVFLSQPFSETLTHQPGVENSSVKIGDEIEKMRRKTAELREFFERKAKEWDAAKAAEDEAWKGIMQIFKSPDTHGAIDDQLQDFIEQAREEEQKAFEAMDSHDEIFKEEKASVEREMMSKLWA